MIGSGQHATNSIMLFVVFVYSALLNSGCSPTDPQPLTIVLGEQVTADDYTPPSSSDNSTSTGTPPPASGNQAPIIYGFTGTGTLISGLSCAVTISCTAGDPDGQVQSVTADLSQIGGSSRQSLTGNGNQWTWNGTVAPPIAGSRTIVLTATDNQSTIATYSASFIVTAPQAPSVTQAAATGNLIQGRACNLTVSCNAADVDGSVRSVTVDLSQVGGPNSQSLTASGGQWTWVGRVTPPVAGTRTIPFTASDNGSLKGTGTATITVVVDQALVIGNAIATGTLIQGKSCSLTVACTASDPDGTVQAVTADLSQVGGSVSQGLTNNGNQWTWSGTVTPRTPGLASITLKATSESAATANVATSVLIDTGDAPVPPSGRPPEQANWIFLMPSRPIPDLQAVIQGIQKTKISIVILYQTLWDWYENPTTDQGLMSRTQVMELVHGLRNAGITVGFHFAAYYPTYQAQLAWVTKLGAPKLQALGAQVLYVDVFDWDHMSECEAILHNMIGPDGFLMEFNVDPSYIDGYGSVDQGDPSKTFHFSHPRHYVDWHILMLEKLRETNPRLRRFDLGWIGEYDDYKAVVTRWPLSDYAYVWARSRESGFPLTYRTTMESAARRNDPCLDLIGAIEQTPQASKNVSARWSSLAMSSDGTRLVAAQYGGRLYTSVDSGVSWTERQPAGGTTLNWSRVASSPDGTRLLVGAWPGRLFISADSGSTWAERQPAGNVSTFWEAFAMSDNGARLVARVAGRDVYTSADFGASWTKSQPMGKDDGHSHKIWANVAMSSNGSKMAMIDEGYVYTSGNSGADWTARQPLNNEASKSCLAMSGDGNRIAIGAWPGRLYLSTNTGMTWTEIQPAGSVDAFWQCVSMSADGTHIVAGTWAGRLFVSMDSGKTWIERQPAGNVDKYWESAAMSADGTTIVVTDGDFIYTSVDSGGNWIARQPGGIRLNL